MLGPEELERYARHIVLREVGGPGQAALKRARVLVVGAGGLGEYIYRGLSMVDTTVILAGAIPAAALALLVDLGLWAAQRLSARLKEWTGERWLLSQAGGGGAESLWEKQKREQREVRASIEQDPFVRGVMDAFPGAEIVGIRTLATGADAEPAPPEETDEE